MASRINMSQSADGSSTVNQNDELTFHQFPRLPRELQKAIWGFALNSLPPFTKVQYDSEIQQFVSCSGANSIVSVCGKDDAPSHWKAIYLKPSESDEASNMRVEPIFIRPDQDILYIPCLELLDCEAFLACQDNRALQYITIFLSTKHKVPDSTAIMDRQSNFFFLLDTLESLYVVDPNLRVDDVPLKGGYYHGGRVYVDFVFTEGGPFSDFLPENSEACDAALAFLPRRFKNAVRLALKGRPH